MIGNQMKNIKVGEIVEVCKVRKTLDVGILRWETVKSQEE